MRPCSASVAIGRVCEEFLGVRLGRRGRERSPQGFGGSEKAFGLHPEGFRNSEANLTALHSMDLLSPYHVISWVSLIASVPFQISKSSVQSNLNINILCHLELVSSSQP